MTEILSRLGAAALGHRSLVRAPIWLYRHRLGSLLGPRVLMLEHIGRKSGRPRFACLEVVDRPSPRAYVLASGFGERAQWYRNLQADPRCWLTIGSRSRRPAHARFMDDSESEAVLARYRSTHPEAWRLLRGAIERITSRPVTTLPMVEVTID